MHIYTTLYGILAKDIIQLIKATDNAVFDEKLPATGRAKIETICYTESL